MKYKGALFFDLDGTLLDNQADVIPESAKLAIRKLKENGYLVCLSTGRDMDTDYSAKYLEAVGPDAVIHMNGSKITAGGKTIVYHRMEKELLRRLVEYSRENGFCTGATVGSFDYYTDPQQKLAADRKWNRFIKRNFQPVEKLFEENIPVVCVNFASSDILEVKRRVERDIPEVRLFPFNGNTGADVVELGFSKAQGIRTVCGHYGIRLENTWAFGDSANDLPMFEAAAFSVAMGNADEEVKKRADLITERVEEDGIYNALFRIGLIG